MKTCTPELHALLHGSDQFLMCDLYRITLGDGQRLHYASADVDVMHQGTLWRRGPLITRTATRVVLGLEVDTCTLTVAAGDGHRIGGLPWVQAVAAGALDGAMVDIERAFFTDWHAPAAGTVNLFSGRVSTVPRVSRNSCEMELRSHLSLLDVQMPAILYEASCNRTEYSAGCGANKAAMTVTGVVTAPSTSATYLQSNLTQPDGWFDMGAVTFTSGANAGQTRTVKSYGQGLVRVAMPLPHAPQAGDAFRIYPGCDKTKATCERKFNNIVHFRGYPFVPPAETAM